MTRTQPTTTTKTNHHHRHFRASVAVAALALAASLLVGSGAAAIAKDQPDEGTSARATAPNESAPAEPAAPARAASSSRIATKSFANSSPILIPGDLRAKTGRGGPYPSEIEVSGFPKGSRITNVKATLNGLTHTIPDDIDLLLVGPKGQNMILMSDVGGSFPAQNVTLSLDDAFETADGPLPDNQVLAGANGFGSFAPNNIGSGDAFPAPAPAPSTSDKLSVFNGTNPNGTWKLFALDDEAAIQEAGTRPDVGELTRGWSLEITAKRRHR